MEKNKKSTLGSLKIATENYQFRYRETLCFLRPAQEDASWQSQLRLWEDRHIWLCMWRISWLHCKGRNAPHYWKLWSHAFIQQSWLAPQTVQGQQTEKSSLFSFSFFMLKPGLWLELNLLWIYCRFLLWQDELVDERPCWSREQCAVISQWELNQLRNSQLA